MDRDRFIKIKMLADGLLVEFIFEKVHSLQGICLFDVTGSKNAIPGPMIYQWQVLFIKIGNREVFLIKKSILLHIESADFVFWEVNILTYFAPVCDLLWINAQAFLYFFGRLSHRFELFIAGREIANGFSELNDPEEQADRFRAQVANRDAGDDEAMGFDHDYIRALEYGLPPTAGSRLRTPSSSRIRSA